MGEHDLSAIAQPTHCDRPNHNSHRKKAIAPHVLKQNQAIASFSRER
jgi:hypothetical protein